MQQENSNKENLFMPLREAYCIAAVRLRKKSVKKKVPWRRSKSAHVIKVEDYRRSIKASIALSMHTCTKPLSW